MSTTDKGEAVPASASPVLDQAAPATPEATSASYRPMIQMLARLIASDRRAVLLANEAGEVLLANGPAKRLGVERTLRDRMNWTERCTVAKRAGSAPVSITVDDLSLEGELVLLPLGPAAGFYLRLSETDGEALWLRNRARAATLLRVTHDLRTPIQSLLASAETLVLNKEHNQEGLERLKRAAELSLDHISNVLAVIRGEQSGAAARPDEAFSIAQELRQMTDVIRPLAEQRGAALSLSLPPEAETCVTGPVRFVRALSQNMVDNAVKHGGEAIEVILTTARLGSDIEELSDTDRRLQITLEVRDMGGGLPRAQKERLRQALGQAGGATPAPPPAQDRPSGGMNVLAHALTQLGGHLDILDRGVDGTPVGTEGGAVVGTILRAVFSLPAAELADTTFEQEAPQEIDGLLKGASLLVVEDSPASQAWLSHVLRAAGAAVQVAGSGAAALALLEHRADTRFDLVLSDVTLPQMSGVELAQRIAAGIASGAITPAPRIVGLTAHIEDSIRAACLKAGMQSVLEKPIRPDPLCHAIRDALDPDIRTPPRPRAAATRKGPGRPPRPAPDAVLSDSVVTELVAGLGADGARRYMSRALAEASAAIVSLKAHGVTDQTDCMLHAATGACGLTGLAGLDSSMRLLEDAVKAGKPDLSAEMARVTDALTRTTQAIAALGADPAIG
ncbi:hybrid sensor histidine kinase/response regulator [Ponticoccus litoralis]|uniref:histidine kinase n=1 Tax=Ponticoccus litoralis TaxID=422297 RepID=A0AAW9S5M4_9RHOB